MSFRTKTSAGGEGESPALEVFLSAPAGRPVSVKYRLAGGTARAGTDFTFTPGMLTFAPGETSKVIPLTGIHYHLDEPDETVQVSLFGPVNAAAGPAMRHTYTLRSNDPIRTVSFDIATAQAGEAAGTVLMTVRLSAAAPFPVSVRYGLDGGTAVGGRDYALRAGRLTFRAGETEKTILVRVINDRLDEPAETVRVRLSEPVSAVLGSTDLFTLIHEDDDPA